MHPIGTKIVLIYDEYCNKNVFYLIILYHFYDWIIDDIMYQQISKLNIFFILMILSTIVDLQFIYIYLIPIHIQIYA